MAIADQVKARASGHKGQIGAARMGAAFGTTRDMQALANWHIQRQPGRKGAHWGMRLQTGGRARAGLDPADRISGVKKQPRQIGQRAQTLDAGNPRLEPKLKAVQDMLQTPPATPSR